MTAKELFKTRIKRIDIENYNICNRKCETCPQSLEIRSKRLEIFDEQIFNKLICELSECNYTETLAIGRYHEPLLLFDLTLERIRYAKSVLPQIRIILNTNGDFITYNRIKILSIAGLDEIKIMQYQDKEFSIQQAKYLCEKMATKLRKKIIKIHSVAEQIYYVCLENEGNLGISVRSENYHSIRGNCRGGLLPELMTSIRKTPCFVVQKSIDIDYNGNVVPCCNMISDSFLHQPYIIGNIHNNSIYDGHGRIMV